VAEGVETALQLDVLKDLGCDYAQGFFLSPPLTVEEFEQAIFVPAS
jgi:EAL domain-containing protein (putative c-di-GMP-specific phosphodiesterase class I)